MIKIILYKYYNFNLKLKMKKNYNKVYKLKKYLIELLNVL